MAANMALNAMPGTSLMSKIAFDFPDGLRARYHVFLLMMLDGEIAAARAA